MSASVEHRSEAEVALADAQKNPVMSAEQWFMSAAYLRLARARRSTRGDRGRAAVAG